MGYVSTTLTFNNQPRQKADDSTVNVSVKAYVYAPDTPGTYPVIVYSHGTGEPGNQEAPYYADSHAVAWANAGFIVVSISHRDAADATTSQINNLPVGGDTVGAVNSETWNRVQDMKMGLDQVQTLLNALPNGLQYASSGYEVAAGFSFGGATAQIAGGVELKNNLGTVVNWGDARFDAVIDLSAGGTGIYGFFNDGASTSWSNFTKPLLVTAGEKDRSANGGNYQTKLDPFDFAPATGGKHAFVWYGADHNDFSGGSGADLTRSAEINDVTKEFLYAYAYGSTPDLALLQDVDNLLATGYYPNLWQAHYAETQAGNTVSGTSTADLIVGGSYNDTLLGNGGADEIYGDAGDDYIDGGFYDDYLVGGSGRDTILGNTGADTLIGGPGADILTGGAGADVFVYQARGDGGGGGDIITDFVVGTDKINVHPILASIGGSATGFGGYIDLKVVGNDTWIVLDVNNNTNASVPFTALDDEVLAIVKNVTTLSTADFFF